MRVQTWRRISVEDLGKFPAKVPEVKQIVERLLDAVNLQLEKLTDLAERNINFFDNFNSEIVQVEVADDTKITVRLNDLKERPRDAWITYSDQDSYPELNWEVVDQDQVELSVKWQTAPAAKGIARIIFLGD